MLRNYDLLKIIKTTGWNNRTAWQNEQNTKFVSTYAINNAIEKPKDWDAIALKCSENPRHEMFGKSVEEIRAEWSSRASKGQNRGVKLDDYINAYLGGVPMSHDEITDETLLAKCKNFDKLHTIVFNKLHSYIGSELWLNSAKIGLSVRLDSLFTTNNNRELLIAEWKNNESLSTYNKFDKFIGPASHLENTDHNKFTIQVHTYKYILHEYGLFDKISSRIFNIKKDNFKILKPAFEYDKEFVEELVTYTRNKQLTQNQ